MRAASGSSTSTRTTGRITMGLATRGTGFCKPDVVRHDWELAKELGVNITVHVGDGPLRLHQGPDHRAA